MCQCLWRCYNGITLPKEFVCCYGGFAGTSDLLWRCFDLQTIEELSELKLRKVLTNCADFMKLSWPSGQGRELRLNGRVEHQKLAPTKYKNKNGRVEHLDICGLQMIAKGKRWKKLFHSKCSPNTSPVAGLLAQLAAKISSWDVTWKKIDPFCQSTDFSFPVWGHVKNPRKMPMKISTRWPPSCLDFNSAFFTSNSATSCSLAMQNQKRFSDTTGERLFDSEKSLEYVFFHVFFQKTKKHGGFAGIPSRQPTS